MPQTPASNPLPHIATPLSAEQVVDRLGTASRRGRLPGYHAGKGGLFSVAAHGQPFDGLLTGEWREGRLEFQLRMLRKLPVVFAVILVATVWPGVHLVDQLIPGEWGWIPTWWWYLPLSALPLPWAWRALMRRSNAAMHTAALEQLGKITAEVNGQVVESTLQPTPK